MVDRLLPEDHELLQAALRAAIEFDELIRECPESTNGIEKLVTLVDEDIAKRLRGAATRPEFKEAKKYCLKLIDDIYRKRREKNRSLTSRRKK